jgi:hypothetical protein
MIIKTLARIARELVRPKTIRTCEAGHRSMHSGDVCGARDYADNVCQARMADANGDSAARPQPRAVPGDDLG